jgi:hypothetical protein
VGTAGSHTSQQDLTMGYRVFDMSGYFSYNYFVTGKDNKAVFFIFPAIHFGSQITKGPGLPWLIEEKWTWTAAACRQQQDLDSLSSKTASSSFSPIFFCKNSKFHHLHSRTT